MFNNPSKILFMNILIMSTLISISANSWMSAWMGLEINLLSFIPLMNNNKMMSTEASLKYFLIQALASSILLFSVTSFLMNFQENFNNFLLMITFSSLLMKSGSAPFHFWFPIVMEGLSWMNSLILMTWQKIAPLVLISYIMIKPLMIISIILSATIGALGGLNQTSLRKLMAYSSIHNLSWMLISLYINNQLWIMYFMFYSFLSFSIVFLFNSFKISHINQLFSLFMNNKNLKFLLFMNLLSLGGLPPFLGFFPKLLTIQMLVLNNQYLLLMILMMNALITLYFYLRLCFTTFMLNYYENNWMNFSMFKSLNLNIFMMISFFSIFGLMIIFYMFYNF